jgi:hypothetical protein
MEEIRTRARLVDPASGFPRGVSTVVPRAEIEEALATGEAPSPLYLDIARRTGDDEVTAHSRLMVDWDAPTLQELLRTTSDSDVRLSFDADELERALEESEVDAHGMREKIAVIAVAVTAAGAGAGAAAAGTPGVGMWADGGNAPATTSVTAPATTAGSPDSSPLGRYVANIDSRASSDQSDAVSRYAANIANDATTQTPAFTSDVAAGGTGSPANAAPAPVSDVASGGAGGPAVSFTSDVASGGSGVSQGDVVSRYAANVANDAAQAPAVSTGDSATTPSAAEDAALFGGLALLITGAGFVAARSRKSPELPA